MWATGGALCGFVGVLSQAFLDSHVSHCFTAGCQDGPLWKPGSGLLPWVRDVRFFRGQGGHAG